MSPSTCIFIYRQALCRKRRAVGGHYHGHGVNLRAHAPSRAAGCRDDRRDYPAWARITNGHNGLRSITQALGTNEYIRVRFGIGRPPGRMDAATYVLRDFSAAERKELPLVIDRCADAVETVLSKGVAAAQNTFHAD